jgi:hypothetical protein
LPRYGALGTFGVRGPGVEAVDLPMAAIDHAYGFQPAGSTTSTAAGSSTRGRLQRRPQRHRQTRGRPRGLGSGTGRDGSSRRDQTG